MDGLHVLTTDITMIRAMPINPKFTCDRSFVFLIRDNLTGIILISGHVTDPSKQNLCPLRNTTRKFMFFCVKNLRINSIQCETVFAFFFDKVFENNGVHFTAVYRGLLT